MANRTRPLFATCYSLFAPPKVAGARQVFRRAPLTHQPACKPGFVRRGLAPPRDGHSSGTPVARRLKQPTRAADPDTDLGSLPRRPYSVLLPVGFAVPFPSPETRCALTAPFHPYRDTQRPRRSALCGTFPEIRPAFTGQAPPDVIRHRMSMEPGLSSTAAFRPLPQRPSGRLTSIEVVASMDCVKPAP